MGTSFYQFSEPDIKLFASFLHGISIIETGVFPQLLTGCFVIEGLVAHTCPGDELL